MCCYDIMLVNVAAYVIRNYTKLHTINTTCKLPEDGVLTPKHVGVININLHNLFVHMLVYSKHLIICDISFYRLHVICFI